MTLVGEFTAIDTVPVPRQTVERTDVVVLDLSLGDNIPGADNLTRVVQWGPNVVVNTMYDNDVIRDECRRLGARGFVGKSTAAAALPQVIRLSMRRPFVDSGVRAIDVTAPLTQTDKRVLAVLPHETSSAAIAKKIHMSKGAVDNAISVLLTKTRTGSRAELAAWAVENGFAHLRRSRPST